MAQYILVVDDDAGLLNLMKMRLESAGYTVDTAGNGWDGLTKLKHADYDLVLLDYMMPGITGLTALQHIQERHPSIPVVMMTSHTRSQVAARALAAGAQACLFQPIDRIGLTQAMQCGIGTAVYMQPNQATENDAAANATGDGPINISFGNLPRTDNEPRIEDSQCWDHSTTTYSVTLRHRWTW